MNDAQDIFAHRRGLMLGLTLAEVLLLILFILLLTYTVILLERDQAAEAKEEKIAELQTTNTDLEAQINVGLSDLINSVGLGGIPVADLEDLDLRLREALEVTSRTKLSNEKLSKLVPSPDHAERLADQLELISDAPKATEIIEGWIEENQPTEGADVGAGAETVEPEPQTVDEALKVIERLKNQNEFYERRMRNAGNGLTYPSCWYRDSKAVYIYDISLLDDGLKVSRSDSREGLDLSALDANGAEPDFGVEIGFGAFSDRTRGLHQWSVDQKCRFYVRLRDETSEDNKDGYKRAKQRVENHFYKWEP